MRGIHVLTASCLRYAHNFIPNALDDPADGHADGGARIYAHGDSESAECYGKSNGTIANVAEAGRELHPDYGRTQTDGRRALYSGLRVPVTTIVGMVADGMSRRDVVVAYPDLTIEGIDDSLRNAAQAGRERSLSLVEA